LLSIPPYIPSLEKTILILISSLYILGFIFMFLFDVDYVRYEIRSKNPGFLFRFTLVNMVLWGYFFAFIGISALLFGGGIFGPKFIRSEEFPEIGASIYLYDASFFGKAVSVKVRDPLFPYFSKELAILDDAEPNSMGISQEKEWIRISPPSGKRILYNSLTGQTFKEN
jgi:hypothetical protein